MSELTLQVNGKNFGGWQSISVTLGMEQITGSFDLTVSDRGRPDAWALLPGDACRVLLGKATVITGYIDDVNPDYDKESHSIQVTGRDRAGDLVDCSAIHKTGSWHNARLEKIIADLCSPFGIAVKVVTDTGVPFVEFSVWHSETAFEAIDRACRMRGVLPVSDGQGRLQLTRAGKERIATPLVKGQNIERASGQFSHKDRHSRYIVKGQSASPATNWQSPEGQPKDHKHHTQVKSFVDDDAITRYRPLIVVAEQGSGSTYYDRAVWERNIRIGRGSRVTYTVTGWEHAAGLWLPNRLVTVQDDYQGINGDLIISQVRFTAEEEAGSKTELTCCKKEAFELINLPDKHKHKQAGKASLKW
jgi:prophage tail gpP-like protein